MSDRRPDQEDKAAAVVLENYAGDDVLRSAQPLRLRSLLIALLAPPLVFCGFAIVRSGRVGKGLAKFRGAAAGSAYKALDAARSPAEVAHVVLAYVAGRLDVNPNSLTRGEAVALLRERGVIDASRRLDELLEQCEQRAYAGIDRTDDPLLAIQAKECLRRLSQQRFSRTAQRAGV